MITDLINLIAVDGVVWADWMLSTMFNRWVGKRDSPRGQNYRGLKLTGQILAT